MSLWVTVREELEKMKRAVARGDGDGIASALSRLDEIVRTERDRLPPRLVHFLERRSYEKAGSFLDEEAAAGGGDARS